MAYYVAIPHRFSPEYLGADGPDDDASVNLWGETVGDLAAEIDRHIERRGHQWMKLAAMRTRIMQQAQGDEVESCD